MIINADDFGLSEAVNYGILKAYREGVVTSTTIMANMPGFDHAITLLKQHPGLSVGVHLTLTAYKPIVKTQTSLVDSDGYFCNKSEIDKVNIEEAYTELKAQIEKVKQQGIAIDHFDSHHHIHTVPTLQPVMERLYQEYGLPFRGGFEYESKINRSVKLDMRFYEKGVSLQQFKTIVQSIAQDEVVDVMCHPAYVDKFLSEITTYAMKRMDEVELLCGKEVKQIIVDEGIELTNYANI